MSRPLRIQSCLRFLSAAVLALVLHGVQPQQTLASCGDWLAGHQPESSAGDAADDGSFATDLSAPVQTPAVPLDTPQPCEGPGCRRAPHAPPPPAPQRTLGESQDRWFTLAGRPLIESTGTGRLVLEEALDLPAGLLPRVERPPRV